MVSQTQMFVSQKGVASDMQGPPPAPCQYCRGMHWDHFCPMNGQTAPQTTGQGHHGVAMPQMNPMQAGAGPAQQGFQMGVGGGGGRQWDSSVPYPLSGRSRHNNTWPTSTRSWEPNLDSNTETRGREPTFGGHANVRVEGSGADILPNHG